MRGWARGRWREPTGSGGRGRRRPPGGRAGGTSASGNEKGPRRRDRRGGPGEDRQSLPVLGRQQRKRSPAARCRAAEIVEERRSVRVAGVDLVPERAPPADGEGAG